MESMTRVHVAEAGRSGAVPSGLQRKVFLNIPRTRPDAEAKFNSNFDLALFPTILSSVSPWPLWQKKKFYYSVSPDLLCFLLIGFF